MENVRVNFPYPGYPYRERPFYNTILGIAVAAMVASIIRQTFFFPMRVVVFWIDKNVCSSWFYSEVAKSVRTSISLPKRPEIHLVGALARLRKLVTRRRMHFLKNTLQSIPINRDDFLNRYAFLVIFIYL